MKTFRCENANRLCFIFFALLLLLTAAPACQAAEGRQLWQSRDQFVALERQDSGPGESVPLNDHPVEISPERLTAILASIRIQPADNSKAEQLMTYQSLEVLVPQLVQGFRQAAPNEDLTFAIIGLHKSILGLAKSPRVTTGRAFYQGGRLNIIFGLVQQDFNEREDRRLAPFTPGSRGKRATGEWTLLSQPGQSGYQQPRKDWLTFTDHWQAAIPRPPEVEQKVSPRMTPAERLTTLKELQEKNLISEEEYRRKRDEILNGL